MRNFVMLIGLGALVAFAAMGWRAPAHAETKMTADQISTGYTELESKVKNATSEAAIHSAFDLAMKLLRNDPSNYAVEVIYPLYKKHPNVFKMLLNNSPVADRDLFMQCLEAYEAARIQGNG